MKSTVQKQVKIEYMLLFFGLVKRYKERKREAKIKQAHVARVVRNQIQFIEDKINKLWLERIKDFNDLSIVKNHLCPKCGSKHCVDKMGDKTSSLNGELSGSHSSLFGCGGGEVAATIIGTTEILPYNLCKHCGHEWKKISIHHKYLSDLRNAKFNMLAEYVSNYYDLKHVSYDPTDLSEVYYTLDEKIRVYTERLNEPHRIATIKDFFGTGIFIETIRHFYEKLFGYGCGTYWDNIHWLNQSVDHLVKEFGFVDETKI